MYHTREARRPPISTESYYAKRYLDVERSSLFSRSWLLVGSDQSFSRPGDYISVNPLGIPVVVWLTPIGLRAFVNICAHRHSIIVGETSGNCQRLVCPYHGWEYDSDGVVSRIPDAWSFKPYNKTGSHRLKVMEVDTCGCLVFVRIGSDGCESLEQFLGQAQHRILETVFPKGAPLYFRRENKVPCNWKLAVENAMEDLHTRFLHRETFPTDFSQIPLSAFWMKELEDGAHGVMGGIGPLESEQPPGGTWLSHNVLDIFPGMHFVWGPGAAAVVDTWYPIDPSSTSRTTAVFGNLRFELPDVELQAYIQATIQTVEKVRQEDEWLLPRLQIGVAHSPHQGLVGVREERLHVLHNYLASAYQLELSKGPES